MNKGGRWIIKENKGGFQENPSSSNGLQNCVLHFILKKKLPFS